MAHQTDLKERGSLFYFDAIRFFAASAVVVSHLRDVTWLTAGETGHLSPFYRVFYVLSGFGAEAVTLFFVLSGFWITHAIERRRAQPNFWLAYVIDRLSRLLIVVVPALLLGAMLDCMGRYGLRGPLYLGSSGSLSLPDNVGSTLDPVTFLGNMLFLQTIFVKTFGTNGPMWSLANEFWYYLWFPALLLSWRLRRPQLALLTLGIAVAAPFLLAGFAVWLMGSALYYADLHVARSLRPPVWALAGSGGLVLALLLLSRLQLVPADIKGGLVGAAFSLFLWLLLRRDPPPLRLFLPLTRYGANASFSLYLTHLPLVALAITLWHPGGRQAPSLLSLLAMGLLYLAVLAYAYGFSRLTEAHTGQLRGLLRRLARVPAPRSAPTPPLA